MKLARKQGMNTDIRRSIFVVLMSSEVSRTLDFPSHCSQPPRKDYVDACGRLGQLNLTEIQQREIVRVLLHCCGNVRGTFFPCHDLLTKVARATLQEKAYNPYYTLVCQELCRFSHSYAITLQFCLWDFLRELGESNVGGIELLKRQDEPGFAPQGKLISRHRLENIARAYSWWAAKDCCSLTIFKVFNPHCTTSVPPADEVNSLSTF